MTNNYNLKILIVEDEVFIADFIETILNDAGYFNIQKAHNKLEAQKSITNNTLDIILMDININGKMEGIELVKKLPYNCGVIYITGQSDIKVVRQAVATHPKAYLTKPIKKTDLLSNIAIAEQQKQAFHFEVKDGHTSVRLCADDILFIKSDNNYIDIVTKNRRYALRETLKQFLKEINCNDFVQVHRSYVVNKKAITKRTSTAIFIDKEEIPASRNFELL
ncbi:MAG: response regulator transcription factor [Chitinophagales bacterium]|nr:response regulator transcription factor [Chitinophagales bacterium]